MFLVYLSRSSLRCCWASRYFLFCCSKSLLVSLSSSICFNSSASLDLLTEELSLWLFKITILSSRIFFSDIKWLKFDDCSLSLVPMFCNCPLRLSIWLGRSFNLSAWCWFSTLKAYNCCWARSNYILSLLSSLGSELLWCLLLRASSKLLSSWSIFRVACFLKSAYSLERRSYYRALK